MQSIYGGKTAASYRKFDFPSSFSLSTSEKHFSNTNESLKLIKEVILPYVKEQKKSLDDENQAALLIIDVFRGQMTVPVTQALKNNNIILVKIPPNITHIYKPLDLTVNRSAKLKFTKWYSNKIHRQPDEGKQIDQVEVLLRLSVLKPLHAKWIIEFYDDMATPKGKDVIANGWKSSGITETLERGKNDFDNLDPFSDIEPLVDSTPHSTDTGQQILSAAEIEMIGYQRSDFNDDDDEKEIWEDPNEGDSIDRNIFDILDD